MVNTRRTEANGSAAENLSTSRTTRVGSKRLPLNKEITSKRNPVNITTTVKKEEEDNKEEIDKKVDVEEDDVVDEIDDIKDNQEISEQELEQEQEQEEEQEEDEVEEEEAIETSELTATESEESSDVDDWEHPAKKKKILTGNKKRGSLRIRQLRNRFGNTNQNSYTSGLRSKNLRKHKHKLSIYSKRNMHSDYNGSDSEDEKYVRRRTSRHLSQHMARIERRTALSLRPIMRKSYADSTLQFNSESEDVTVRRSKRNKNFHSKNNVSWLDDHQMLKVGYPNINKTNYPDDYINDDDGQDENESRRNLRHTEKRREIKNPKYLQYYESNNLPSRRNRNEPTNKKELNNRIEENDKENKEENCGKRRRINKINNLRSNNNNNKNNDNNDDNKPTDNEDNKNLQENGVANGNDESNEATNVEENKLESSASSDSRSANSRKNSKLLLKQKYELRRKIIKKNDSTSSESEEEHKRYSLRNRQPKPVPMKSSALRNIELPHSRRRYTRRRKITSSSSSSSSSDPDVRCEKFTKQPKSPHSKNEKMKSGVGSSKIIPIGPENLDENVRFSSIGGLDSHIVCLKEMILLPMMYPEVFQQFHLTPPKGVLFHGPPGTGKTLLARALANECSIGRKKVAFFMRKGADLLSKWIGESEKQLRLLFEQASQMQPSIIFFDELDGLAPIRSSRQDQVHASIVATLLALMDGLDNRGEVIVIGATNRIDSIDPALRRPGRFDRELYFPLPSRRERESILRVHVSQWSKPPDDKVISQLAEFSNGYCGSDLRALCCEAIFHSFQRIYPQVYTSDYKLLLNPENVIIEKVDFYNARARLVPSSQRIAPGLARSLLPVIDPLLGNDLQIIMNILKECFPHGSDPSHIKIKVTQNLRLAHLLIIGDNNEFGQTKYLAPAVLYEMEHIPSYLLDITTLNRQSGITPEEACIQIFNEARRNIPSIIYIPNIDSLWELIGGAVKAIIETNLLHIEPHVPILLLATSNTNYIELPSEIKNIFSFYRNEIYKLKLPNYQNRKEFFYSLILNSSLIPPPPIEQRPNTPPILPKAPTPPPTPLTDEQNKKLFETEEHTLRELRIFLRDMCKKLANNKLFYMFTKPVDTEEVPDYTTIIKEPMDLETMMTKVDLYKYNCAKDFLDDIELICQNALEYNPAKTSADKQIRHRACSLRDYAYTLIKNEMDSDFEEKCQKIANNRLSRNARVANFLPHYIQTPDNINIINIQKNNKCDNDNIQSDNDNINNHIDNNDIDNDENINDDDDDDDDDDDNDDKEQNKLNELKENNNKLMKEQDVIIVRPSTSITIITTTTTTTTTVSSSSSNSSRSSISRKRKIPSWQRGMIKKIKRRDKHLDNNNIIKNNCIEEEDNDDTTKNSLTSNDDLSETKNDYDMSVSNGSPSTISTSPTTILLNNNNSTIIHSNQELTDESSETNISNNDNDKDSHEQDIESPNPLVVICNRDHLVHVLRQVVETSHGIPVQILLDLYNLLSRIIKSFSLEWDRSELPKILSNEIEKFIRQVKNTSLNMSQ